MNRTARRKAEILFVLSWFTSDCQCTHLYDSFAAVKNPEHGGGRSGALASGDPFDLPARGTPLGGVLCIHGFTGTPFEMRHLGQRLSERGLAAVGPALPGHLSTPAALDATTWHDWYGAVERAFDDLRRRVPRVAVVGQSLGGLLALRLAAHRGADMAAVASLAAPLWLSRLGRMAVRATRPPSPLGRWIRSLPKLGGSDVRDPLMRRQNPAYREFPVRAVQQLADFMDVVGRELHLVRVPTLILHARRDHTAPYESSRRIATSVSAPVLRHRALARSYHLIAIDVERDVVAAEVGDFFATQCMDRDRRRTV